MKTRLVIWGQDAQDNKVLLAIGLKEKENKVDLYIFPEEAATEALYNDLMDKWRNGQDVEFPENHQYQERPLTVSESILPDEIKVDRSDVILRAQAEWHFVVLSTKLHESYKEEVDMIKEKISRLNEFENGVWEELKSFWDKVQHQVREKNLFREHAEELKESTNELFGKLKDMRKKMDDEFKTRSKEFVDSFMEELNEIQKKLEDGLGLKPIFEDLKKLQNKLKDTAFTKEHRRVVWQKIDQLFKDAKAKKGETEKRSSGPAGSGYDRVHRRLEGLLQAIEKMDSSIKRDRKELDFQNRRIAETDGQLEAQLRQAKLVMIEQRIESKEEKLAEMRKTQSFLEDKLKKEEQKVAKMKEQEEVEKMKEQVKDKIQDEIEQQKAAMKEQEEALLKAAEAIKEAKGGQKAVSPDEASAEAGEVKTTKKEESTLEHLEELVEDTIEDVVDSVKAVASVVSDKVSNFVNELLEEKEGPVAEAQSSTEFEAEGTVEEENKEEESSDKAQ